MKNKMFKFHTLGFVSLVAAWMSCHPLRAAAAESAAPPSGTAAANSKIVLVDRIIAVVNKEVITQSELDERYKIVSKQLQKQGTRLPDEQALQRQVLERMIGDKVQLQQAKETGLRVDDNQLDKTLQRIAQENKLTLDQLRQALSQDGIRFDKFREDIRNEIIITRLRERDVENKIVVSESEVENFLSSPANQVQNEEYRLGHILVRTPEQATPEQLKERRGVAEKALKELKGGAPFDQIAAAFSDGPEALQGGMVGWRSGGQVPTLFQDAVKKLQVGELSQILRSPNGFHIIKLFDKRGADSPMLMQQTHVRHILVKTNELLSEKDAKNRLIQLKERIENGADFAKLARLQSEDPSSAKGGDLGWISAGDTVPEFERAMDALKPMQISEPIQSPFGWHLIQVLERRTEDVSKERRQRIAREQLRSRKSDEAYQEWLRQLRDQAYVEYRLEDKA